MYVNYNRLRDWVVVKPDIITLAVMHFHPNYFVLAPQHQPNQ